MGVYRKVGEVNGEDQYRQLDSRRSGHVLHLQVKQSTSVSSVRKNFQYYFPSSLETATDQFQWQIEKPCSRDHNGEMSKRVDPTDTSLFSHSNTSFLSPLFSNWMFKAEYVYGKMIADEDCKVVKFSPFLHEQCNRITIKTPYLESGGGVYLPISEYSAGRMVFAHIGTRRRLFLFVNPETGFWEVRFLMFDHLMAKKTRSHLRHISKRVLFCRLMTRSALRAPHI